MVRIISKSKPGGWLTVNELLDNEKSSALNNLPSKSPNHLIRQTLSSRDLAAKKFDRVYEKQGAKPVHSKGSGKVIDVVDIDQDNDEIECLSPNKLANNVSKSSGLSVRTMSIEATIERQPASKIDKNSNLSTQRQNDKTLDIEKDRSSNSLRKLPSTSHVTKSAIDLKQLLEKKKENDRARSSSRETNESSAETVRRSGRNASKPNYTFDDDYIKRPKDGKKHESNEKSKAEVKSNESTSNNSSVDKSSKVVTAAIGTAEASAGEMRTSTRKSSDENKTIPRKDIQSIVEETSAQEEESDDEKSGQSKRIADAKTTIRQKAHEIYRDFKESENKEDTEEITFEGAVLNKNRAQLSLPTNNRFSNPIRNAIFGNLVNLTQSLDRSKNPSTIATRDLPPGLMISTLPSPPRPQSIADSASGRNSPVLKLPKWWRKEIVKKTKGDDAGKLEVHICGPEGKRFRSKEELKKFCRENPRQAISQLDLNTLFEISDNLKSSLIKSNSNTASNINKSKDIEVVDVENQKIEVKQKEASDLEKRAAEEKEKLLNIRKELLMDINEKLRKVNAVTEKAAQLEAIKAIKVKDVPSSPANKKRNHDIIEVDLDPSKRPKVVASKPTDVICIDEKVEIKKNEKSSTEIKKTIPEPNQESLRRSGRNKQKPNYIEPSEDDIKRKDEKELSSEKTVTSSNFPDKQNDNDDRTNVDDKHVVETDNTLFDNLLPETDDALSKEITKTDANHMGEDEILDAVTLKKNRIRNELRDQFKTLDKDDVSSKDSSELYSNPDDQIYLPLEADDAESSTVTMDVLNNFILELDPAAYLSNIRNWDSYDLYVLEDCYSNALYSLFNLQKKHPELTYANLPEIFSTEWLKRNPGSSLTAEQLIKIHNDRKRQKEDISESTDDKNDNDISSSVNNNHSQLLQYNPASSDLDKGLRLKNDSIKVSSTGTKIQENKDAFDFHDDNIFLDRNTLQTFHDDDELNDSPSLEVESWKIEQYLKIHIFATLCGGYFLQEYQKHGDDLLPKDCPLCIESDFSLNIESPWSLINHANIQHLELVKSNKWKQMCNECDLYFPTLITTELHFRKVHPSFSNLNENRNCGDIVNSLRNWERLERIDEKAKEEATELVTEYESEETVRMENEVLEIKRRKVLQKQKEIEEENAFKRQQEIDKALNNFNESIKNSRYSRRNKILSENSSVDFVCNICSNESFKNEGKYKLHLKAHLVFKESAPPTIVSKSRKRSHKKKSAKDVHNKDKLTRDTTPRRSSRVNDTGLEGLQLLPDVKPLIHNLEPQYQVHQQLPGLSELIRKARKFINKLSDRGIQISDTQKEMLKNINCNKVEKDVAEKWANAMILFCRKELENNKKKWK